MKKDIAKKDIVNNLKKNNDVLQWAIKKIIIYYSLFILNFRWFLCSAQYIVAQRLQDKEAKQFLFLCNSESTLYPVRSLYLASPLSQFHVSQLCVWGGSKNVPSRQFLGPPYPNSGNSFLENKNAHFLLVLDIILLIL